MRFCKSQSGMASVFPTSTITSFTASTVQNAMPLVAHLVAGRARLALFQGGRASRRSSVFVLFMSLMLTGCGFRPVPLLTASFSPGRVVYDASKPSLPLDLVVSNAGNRALQVFSVDAGCSCRHVDWAQLPASLRPGESLELALSLGGSPVYDAQNCSFSFHTDHGELPARAFLLALPNHHLSPKLVTLNGLYEGIDGNDDSFELVHRAVYRPSRQRETPDLIFPAQFTTEKIASQVRRVESAPEYVLEDTTYRLTLKELALGAHRADVLVRGADGRKIADTTIVWQRLPFLSSIPACVTLSSGPARAFLRCPDESVELSRVLSAPKGVRAVLNSAREVVVTPRDDEPETIDGFVEIETTGKGRATLRIPVTRHAPPAQKH
jgi:hypothetical protein